MASTTDNPPFAEAAGHGDDHHDHPAFLHHHYDTPEQQFDAAKFAMWVFIVTEILMFGGLFVAYGIFRSQEPEIFHLAHEHLNKIMGSVNTIVLLFSSLTAALAVREAQLGNRGRVSMYLIVTVLCACVFLVIKYFEYAHKFHDGLLPGRYFFAHLHTHPGEHPLPYRAHMFFALYFMMTGLHGIHVLVGMSILIWAIKVNMSGKITPEYFTPIEIGALYWHLVDLVWIYLFPLLYLVG
jgi:cytochrome c oxidase subunit 3